MPRKQAQGIVGYASARTQQDHRHGLMRNLVDGWRQAVLAAQEVQAAINDSQLATRKPQQAVAVHMRDTGRLQAQAALQHGGYFQPARWSSSMPKPNERCR